MLRSLGHELHDELLIAMVLPEQQKREPQKLLYFDVGKPLVVHGLLYSVVAMPGSHYGLHQPPHETFVGCQILISDEDECLQYERHLVQHVGYHLVVLLRRGFTTLLENQLDLLGAVSDEWLYESSVLLVPAKDCYHLIGSCTLLLLALQLGFLLLFLSEELGLAVVHISAEPAVHLKL